MERLMAYHTPMTNKERADINKLPRNEKRDLNIVTDYTDKNYMIFKIIGLFLRKFVASEIFPFVKNKDDYS